jgi:hypothetical protein
MILTVLALAASIVHSALSAPVGHDGQAGPDRSVNLLVEFKGPW